MANEFFEQLRRAQREPDPEPTPEPDPGWAPTICPRCAALLAPGSDAPHRDWHERTQT